MRVVVVGEYSGVGVGLKHGFNRLGIECDHIRNSDGYKGIGGSKANSVLVDHILMSLDALRRSLKYRYDLAIFLSPFVFNRPLFINRQLNELITDSSNKSVLLCCTSDSVWWNDWPEEYIRSPRIGALLDRGFVAHAFSGQKYYDYNVSFARSMDGVFTLGACYSVAYLNTEFNTTHIHYPVILPEIETIRKSVDFYHGITRPGMKGSRVIQKLFTEIEQKYPGCEFRVTNRIPFREYESILDRTVVYFDQAYSYGPAMSALYALCRVPLVATGVQTAPGYEKYLEDCPCKDVLDNLNSLESFLCVGDHRKMVKDNRDFVDWYHNPVKVVKSILNEL